MMNHNYLLGTCPSRVCRTVWLTANEKLYLVEGEGTDAVSSQLHSVQHGDLDHPVGLCSS